MYLSMYFLRMRIFFLDFGYDRLRTLYIISAAQKFELTKHKYQSYPKSREIDGFEQNICL